LYQKKKSQCPISHLTSVAHAGVEEPAR